MSLDEIKLTFLIVIILLVCFLTTLTGCRTLDLIKEESASVKKEIEESLDKVGEELVAEYSAKIKRELSRGRARLSDRVRAEIERAAYKIGLQKRKPLTKAERREIRARVEVIKQLPKYKEITRGNIPILEPLAEEESDIFEANYSRPIGYKWEPNKDLKEEFFKRNPKIKGVNEQLQLTSMAVWDMGFNYLVYYGLRTCNSQKRLFKEGKSKINDCKKAQHVQGNATDNVPIEKGKALWNAKVTLGTMAYTAELLFCALKSQRPEWGGYNFRWGGEWKRNRKPHGNSFQDLYHWEIRKGLRDNCSKVYK